MVMGMNINFMVMIRPSFEYGLVIFSKCSLGDAHRLDDVQRRALVLYSGAMQVQFCYKEKWDVSLWNVEGK